jgi:hypothetical protein
VRNFPRKEEILDLFYNKISNPKAYNSDLCNKCHCYELLDYIIQRVNKLRERINYSWASWIFSLSKDQADDGLSSTTQAWFSWRMQRLSVQMWSHRHKPITISSSSGVGLNVYPQLCKSPHWGLSFLRTVSYSGNVSGSSHALDKEPYSLAQLQAAMWGTWDCDQL